MKTRVLLTGLFLLAWAGPAAAIPDAYVVTIDHVELKNASGAWITLVRPDKKVDLVTTDPVVAFFNNKGRIHAGGYVNARMTISGEILRHEEDDPRKPVYLVAKKDFAKPVFIKKGSFVQVKFKLNLEVPISEALIEFGVTADEDKRVFGPDEIDVEY